MAKSIFGEFVDLPWYRGLADLTNQATLCIFKGKEAVPVTHTEFLEAMRNPQSLPLERKRALYLFTTGTEWETPTIVEAIMDDLRKSPDAFIEAAASHTKDERLVTIMCNCLNSARRESVAEYAIALYPFTDWLEGNVYDVIVNLMTKLSYYSVPVLGNEEFYYWLTCIAERSNVCVEMFTALSKVIYSGVDKTANSYKQLDAYGFRISDLLKIGYAVRCNVDRFSRGYRKTDAFKEDLCTALANSPARWSSEDKEFVELLGGRLKQPISASSNYEWFYKSFGFQNYQKELAIDFNSKVNWSKRRSILTETEFNLMLNEAKLDGVAIAKIKPTFKEWHPKLKEFCQQIAPKKYHKFYDAEEISLTMLVQEFGIDSNFVRNRVQTTWGAKWAEEDAPLVEQCLRAQGSLEYVSTVRRLTMKFPEVFDEDVHQFLENADIFGIENAKQFSAEELSTVPREFSGYPYIVRAFLTCENFPIVDLSCMEDIESLLKKCKMGSEFEQIIMLLREGADYVSIRRAISKSDDFHDFTHSYDGNYYLKWTGLSKSQVFYNWDRMQNLLPFLSIFRAGAERLVRYKNMLASTLRTYVCEGELIGTLNNFRSIESLTKGCPWCAEWLKGMEKPVRDLVSLATLGVNYGCWDGVRCYLTDIGIIAESPVVTGSIPCWVIDEDEGEPIQFFFGIPFSEVTPWWSEEAINFDSTLTLNLKRV